jgi:MFS family permease
VVIVAACLIGIGSAIFHPEASRVARLASGGRFGLAQSLFQVGGNFGTAIGPLLAAFIVVPRGQASVAWFSLVALLGMVILRQVGNWYGRYNAANAGRPAASRTLPISRNRVAMSIVVLALLMFSKNTYTASITSYYTFFLIERFDVSVQQSQMMLFLFLGAMALGTVLGGPLGDRFGSKTVIWFSILGVLPFTLALPYADLFWSGVLTVLIGVILASAFPAIVVFAQELVPGRVGMIAGIFFGMAFGIGGIAAAVLGVLADAHGIEFVYKVCFLSASARALDDPAAAAAPAWCWLRGPSRGRLPLSDARSLALSDTAIAAAADAIATARLSLTPLAPAAAGTAPRDLVEAYAVRDAVHARLAESRFGARVGWKIGCTTPVMQTYLGIAHPCAAGLFAGTTHHGDARLRHGDFVKAGVECEIAIRLAGDLPEGPFTAERASAVRSER